MEVNLTKRILIQLIAKHNKSIIEAKHRLDVINVFSTVNINKYLCDETMQYECFIRLFIVCRYRLGFISQWGALAGRYVALCPTAWPWTTTRLPPFHSPPHGNYTTLHQFHYLSLRSKSPK